MAKVALQMDTDIEEAHDIQNEKCYFDGICGLISPQMPLKLTWHTSMGLIITCTSKSYWEVHIVVQPQLHS